MKAIHKNVVLIACSDQTGLIHKITGVLLHYSLNVTETEEFVDHTIQRFFMRIQFEGESGTEGVEQELRKILPASTHVHVGRLQPRKIVVLVSKELHCLGDLLLRYATGELQAEISAVVSQTEDGRELTKRFDIPFHYVPVRGLSREEHERELLKVLSPYQPEYLVLARYMRIFSESFIKCFPERIVNIHHSFLPAFIGKNPYDQAYERGVKIIGATAHFVTENLDEGPIITQAIIPINHADDPGEMARRGQDVEKIVLARATELVFEDRVLVDGRRTIVFE